MQLVATRWTKYGHDRTYLTTDQEATVGWVDNRTGELTVEDEQYRVAAEQWVAANVGVRSANVPTLDAGAAPPPPEAVATTEVDLADNLPGQGARLRATEELAAMKDRSRVGTFIARALDMKTDERSWRIGADGEETVGSRLDKLQQHGWKVLHSVPVGSRGSDIDHLLIGPGGVWTLNTKTHPGKKIWVSATKVLVDGHPEPYLRNSKFEADRVRSALTQRLGWEPFVKSALVFLTGTIIPDVTVKSKPADVEILDRMDIPGVFKRSTGRLDAAQVEAIFSVARWQSTWV